MMDFALFARIALEQTGSLGMKRTRIKLKNTKQITKEKIEIRLGKGVELGEKKAGTII